MLQLSPGISWLRVLAKRDSANAQVRSESRRYATTIRATVIKTALLLPIAFFPPAGERNAMGTPRVQSVLNEVTMTCLRAVVRRSAVVSQIFGAVCVPNDGDLGEREEGQEDLGGEQDRVERARRFLESGTAASATWTRPSSLPSLLRASCAGRQADEAPARLLRPALFAVAVEHKVLTSRRLPPRGDSHTRSHTHSPPAPAARTSALSVQTE